MGREVLQALGPGAQVVAAVLVEGVAAALEQLDGVLRVLGEGAGEDPDAHGLGVGDAEVVLEDLQRLADQLAGARRVFRQQGEVAEGLGDLDVVLAGGPAQAQRLAQVGLAVLGVADGEVERAGVVEDERLQARRVADPRQHGGDDVEVFEGARQAVGGVAAGVEAQREGLDDAVVFAGAEGHEVCAAEEWFGAGGVDLEVEAAALEERLGERRSVAERVGLADHLVGELLRGGGPAGARGP
ncbi:hypothetical protein [Nannocystis pusilla]|uniref:hypothetical protein n=1 Tax=Nannocystis pusilla TaxID=889268 RepID=UPI003B7D156E